MPSRIVFTNRVIISVLPCLFDRTEPGANEKDIVENAESQSREGGIYEREKAVARTGG